MINMTACCWFLFDINVSQSTIGSKIILNFGCAPSFVLQKQLHLIACSHLNKKKIFTKSIATCEAINGLSSPLVNCEQVSKFKRFGCN